MGEEQPPASVVGAIDGDVRQYHALIASAPRQFDAAEHALAKAAWCELQQYVGGN